MEQEKELLNSQISWLNEELKAKSEELLSQSREKGNQILELKCNLENKEDEACLFCIYNDSTFFSYEYHHLPWSLLNKLFFIILLVTSVEQTPGPSGQFEDFQ